MAIQRATIKGRISSVIETRSVFTADVEPIGGDTSQVLWEAYLTNIIVPLQPLLSVVWTAYEYEITIPAAGHWEPFAVESFVVGGAASGDALPNAVAAVLIGKASGLRHVGRKFFSPLAESQTVGNSFVSGAASALATALAAYLTVETGIGGGTLTPGVVDSTGNFHAFVGGFVSSIVGSIRRRKPGIGI